MAIPYDGRTVYFCIDIEASGPAPGRYNMVSIGGVVVRHNGMEHEKGDTFYYEIKPDFDGFDPGAMRIHRLPREYLEEEGRDSKEVLLAIDAFVQNQLQPGERPLFVGHNAPFDWMYVAFYYSWFNLPNPFGYNALDTKALMMGRHQISWQRCNKSKLLKIYPDLQEPPEDMVHNALADAEFQADILIALLDDECSDADPAQFPNL